MKQLTPVVPSSDQVETLTVEMKATADMKIEAGGSLTIRGALVKRVD